MILTVLKCHCFVWKVKLESVWQLPRWYLCVSCVVCISPTCPSCTSTAQKRPQSWGETGSCVCAKAACLSAWRWQACGWEETSLTPAYLASAQPPRQIGGVHRWGHGSQESSLARSLAHSSASISLNTHSWGYRAPPLRPGRNVMKQMEIWCWLNWTRLSKYCITYSFYPAQCKGLLMHSPILSSLSLCTAWSSWVSLLHGDLAQTSS